MSGAIGIYKITDGVNFVSLQANGENGYTIIGWSQTTPEAIYIEQSSPYVDYSYPVARKFNNIFDKLDITVKGMDPDQSAEFVAVLRQLLRKGEDFWITSWSNTPVWVEFRGHNTTNAQYAYVIKFNMPHDNNPMTPNTTDCPSVISGVDLTIEHTHWYDSLVGLCLSLSTEQLANSSSEISAAPVIDNDTATANATASTIALAGGLTFGKDAALQVKHTGIRFRSVPIPAGATIFRSYVRMKASVARAGATCRVNIYGELSATPAEFSTYADFMARARTVAFSSWNPVPAFALDTFYNTPDISPAIQEIVSLGGWAINNDLVVFFIDAVSSNSAYRDIYSTELTLFVEWYDGATKTFGMSTTCNQDVFMVAKHTRGNITSIFTYDTSTATFSANLINSALPYNLFPAIPAIGDIAYFGEWTAIADTGPFSNLIFDLVAGAGLTTIVWEYWNGAWVALAPEDDTKNFSEAGVNSVIWYQPADWTTTAINGVTAYWVRARITAVGAVAVPSQQNRNVYTAGTPFVQTDALTEGDAPANVRLMLRSLYDHINIHAMLLSTRSLSRGADFTPYINIADEQNLPGITVTPQAASVFATNSIVPVGRYLSYTPVGITAMIDIADIQIASPLLEQYLGKFRAFLRVSYIAPAVPDDYTMQLTYTVQSDVVFTSDIVTLGGGAGIGVPNVLDFGEVSSGLARHSNKLLDSGTFSIFASNSRAVPGELVLRDLILMPVDECTAYTGKADIAGYNYLKNYATYDPEYVDLDCITPIQESVVKRKLTDMYLFQWHLGSVGPFTVSPRSAQRIWWFPLSTLNAGVIASVGDIGVRAQALKQQKYESRRGAK